MSNAQHSPHRRRATLAAVVVLAAAGPVAGCGGATVDDSPEETSVAPLTRTTATPSPTTDSPEPNPVTPPPPPPGPAGPGGEMGAREVPGAPVDQGALGPAEGNYLRRLHDGGVDSDAARDQLLGTAHQVCAMPPGEDVNPFALAAAGQLAEQGHTELEPQEAGRLIEDAAREEYCPG